MKPRFRPCLAVLLVLPAMLFAQSETTATLDGVATDATDAAIPGVKVTLTSNDTGIARASTTDERGEYRFLLVPPGIYNLQAEKTGFGVQLTKNLELTVGQTAVLNLKLNVGASAQAIEVNTDVTAIETERATQSDTITQREVRNLPINRRDYLSFALLAPGVSDSKALADSNNFRVRQTPDSGLSFYGSNGRGNTVNVDGGESNDSGGGVRPTVGQDTVQEFQINRSNYSAEYSSSRGGVINIVTKSGGNRFHGSTFGFFRDRILDAADPFAITLQGTRAVRVKPDSNRQQFGATLGGPIVKDKTFFFMGYEQLRRRESNAVPLLTDLSIFQPTAAQQTILAGLPAAAAGQLRAVLTSPQSTVDMFQRNSGVFPFRTDQYQGLIRVDHRVSDRDQLSFRYNITQSFDTNPNLSGLTGYSRGYVQENFDSTALGSWTHTFSPTLINEVRAQFNYNNPITSSIDPFGPALEIAGYGAFNRDRFLPSNVTTRRTELSDTVTFSKGAHNFKIGGYELIRQDHSDSATFFSGRFTFGALPGALVSPALASTSINALQAFNLGLAQSYQQGFGNPVVKATYPLFAGFVQDTWKVRPGLTFDLGVRYEVDVRKPPLPTNKHDVAPRAGFAWSPFADKKTTVRGGYGLFYSAIDFQIDYVVNALNEINGYRQIAQVLTTLNAANPLAVNGPINIFQKLRGEGIIGVPTPMRPILASDLRQFGINISQTGPRPPLTVLFHNSADYQNPYSQQASFSIEHEFASTFSTSVSYIFVRGAHLTTSHDDNLLPAPINPAKGIPDWGVTPDNPTGTKYFKNPLLFQDNVYESTANSFYHGFIFEANKRFGRNVNFSGNYTFSKAIDETTDYNSDFQPNNQLCRRCERALSSFDQRHKVVVFALLQTGRGTTDTQFRRLVSGFVFTPIFRYNSPRPFNLLAGTEVNNDRHNTTDRPPFAGRNTGIGPSYYSFDMRLSRRFSLGETRSLEFLAEGFNVLNHLNYSSVNNVVGVISGPFNLHGRADRGPNDPLGFTAAFDPRRIQLGVRFAF
ncbi:MAG: TonB-dependent receptor [Bryobacteraceae bacterium]